MLPLAEWWYDTIFHSAIKSTPYEIVYGQPPPLHLPYLPGDSSSQVIDRSLRKREELIALLKFHLLRAQNRMKQYADSKRSHREFNTVDYVYLKLHPYHQHSLKGKRMPHKLSPHYNGPYPVIDRIGTAQTLPTISFNPRHVPCQSAQTLPKSAIQHNTIAAVPAR